MSRDVMEHEDVEEIHENIIKLRNHAKELESFSKKN
jgi:hypothetical protein